MQDGNRSVTDTATGVVRLIEGASAVTLACGYAVFVGPGSLDRDGERTSFEAARMSGVRRDEDGRCTHALATYADGSAISFRWNPARGPSYSVHSS